MSGFDENFDESTIDDAQKRATPGTVAASKEFDAGGAGEAADGELRELLGEWHAPAASPLLATRVLDAYRSAMNEKGFTEAANRAVVTKRFKSSEEVANMKRCTTCHEEFADKFAFCPVDGTPLTSGQSFTNIDMDEATLAAGTAHSAAAAMPSSADADALPVTSVTNMKRASASNNGTHATNAAASDANVYVASNQPGTNGSSNGTAHKAAAAAFAGAVAAEETAASDAGAHTTRGVPATRGEYHLTMLQDDGILTRLSAEVRGVAQESRLTLPELKRDPAGYAKRFVGGYSSLAYRNLSQPNVALSIAVAFVMVLTLLSLIFFADGLRRQRAATEPELEVVRMIAPDMQDIPEEQEKPEEGNAGTAKGTGGGSKPKLEKPGGGGGGGRVDAPEPISKGKMPTATLQQPQVLAPQVDPPKIPNPSLPTLATVRADDKLFPPDTRPLPYGAPNSTSTIPSPGRGEGDGMGGGKGSGYGAGEGRGVGPGRGENTGGGDTRLGGGGVGGGGGGTDYAKTFPAKDVTRKAVIISRPEAGYTEEARKNNIQGAVTLRLALTASGQVMNITPIKRLPDGLTEKAIEAAKKIQFTPAQKDGRNVSQWLVVNYNFNIY